MSHENPVFLNKVECPICKTINEFETIKVGSYVEGGRDTDFCPKDIKWKYPRYQSYNPLVYFTAVCTNCYYTREFNNNFKEWKNDNTFRSYRLKPIKEKHLEQLSQAESVIKSLGESIDVSAYPNESAIVKLQLAIIDELLSEHKSNLDLGRFYLRIGWLYRGFDMEENPNQQFMKSMLLELQSSFSVYKYAVQNTADEFTKYDRHLSAHFASTGLTSDVMAMMAPFQDKFATEIDNVQKTFQDFQNSVQVLESLSNEYLNATSDGGSIESGGSGFANSQNFFEFMLGLKKRDSNIVVDEKEALAKSVYYYKEAFASGREITPGNQQIQASYLIAELSRRIGDHDSAREYFNSTIKYGQEFIYQNRNDRSRIALARKILELAIEQGKENMNAMKEDK